MHGTYGKEYKICDSLRIHEHGHALQVLLRVVLCQPFEGDPLQSAIFFDVIRKMLLSFGRLADDDKRATLNPLMDGIARSISDGQTNRATG